MAYNKYKKLKLQYTYGTGDAWKDVMPPKYKAGELIETNSVDCGYQEPQYRWYALPNEYICDGYNKYYKEVYQESTNGGHTWENVTPLQTRTGQLIESNSNDCGYGIEWKPVDNEYICTPSSDGKTYGRYEKLQAYDKKTDTPVDPPIYIVGNLITDGCTEDECNGEPRYQKVYIRNEIKNAIEYQIFERQVSKDCGKTWTKEKDLYYYVKVYITIDENFDMEANSTIVSIPFNYNREGYSFIGSDGELYTYSKITQDLVKINYDTKTVDSIAKVNIPSDIRLLSQTVYKYRSGHSSSTSQGSGYYCNGWQPYYNVDEGKIIFPYFSVGRGVYKWGLYEYDIATQTDSKTEFGELSSILYNCASYYHNGYFYVNIASNDYRKINLETKEIESFTPSENSVWYNLTGSITWEYDFNNSNIVIYQGKGNRQTYSMENYQEISREQSIDLIPEGITFENEDEVPTFNYTPAPQLRTDGNMQAFMYSFPEPPYENEIKNFHYILMDDGKAYIVDHSPYDSPNNPKNWLFMGCKGNIVSYSYQTSIAFVDLSTITTD